MSTWTLSNIYSSDEAFESDVARVTSLLNQPADSLSVRILALQEAGMILHELQSYVECRIAQKTADSDAHIKNGTLAGLKAQNESALYHFGIQIADLDKKAFDGLLKEHEDISFFLKELRSIAEKKGTKTQEEVIHALVSDGYHSFWALYQSYTGKMRIGNLSVGQAYNLLSSADRNVRLKAFSDWTATWKKEADFIAQILNHLAGFRLGMYRVRGWESILEEPLMLNRMEKETLDSMLQAIQEARPQFLLYLEKKAKLLGLKKLSWIDVECPLTGGQEFGWDKACDTIIDAFARFHPKKAAFAKECIEKKWIDAEDREGKAPGGFCVHFPKSKESRIFMTFKGTPLNVATLAHELGHAYHNRCIENLPFFSQQIQMNVAETASTFGEMVVIDRSISEAKTDQDRLALLDDKLQRAVVFFMNLQSRLLFEKSFYEQRKKGFVSADRLCELMVGAQKEAYGDSLETWDPYFWASKLHFYYTEYPFYNFPYTFGYLLSNGLYAHAKEGNFGEKLDAFLADSGKMSIEDLAKKHLNVDLRKPDFWRESIAILTADVENFLIL